MTRGTLLEEHMIQHQLQFTCDGQKQSSAAANVGNLYGTMRRSRDARYFNLMLATCMEPCADHVTPGTIIQCWQPV